MLDTQEEMNPTFVSYLVCTYCLEPDKTNNEAVAQFSDVKRSNIQKILIVIYPVHKYNWRDTSIIHIHYKTCII
jgi:hypothetical protein